jgi:arylsulfatase A-like enzyme
MLAAWRKNEIEVAQKFNYFRMKYLLSSFLILISQSLKSQDKPNIILILADDLGYGDISCYGSDEIKTPNLDKIAAEGVRFTNFYSNGSVCSPTRTALMTGRYQQRVGGLESQIGSNNIGRYDDAIALSDRDELGLPVEFNVIPSVLNKHGYNTAIIGKWHLGSVNKFRPKAHGFDYSIGNLGGGVDYFHHTDRLGDIVDGVMEDGKHDLWRNNLPHRRDGYYMTQLITDESVAWINIQNNSRPFFLYVSYTAPHTPIQGPGDYSPLQKTAEEWGRGDKPAYIAMIEDLDRGVGKILDKLDEKGFSENTIVIFTSDNGCTRLGSAGPLSGIKGDVFEGGIRVPCLIKWPGRIRVSQTSDQLAMTMDLTASIAKAIGAEPTRPFDGIDIIGHIESQEKDFPRTLFWRYIYYDRIRRAVRDNNMKYIYDRNKNEIKEYLFNLETDIGEKNNLMSAEKKEFLRLKNLLEEWESVVIPERQIF